MQTLFVVLAFVNLCIFGFGLFSLTKDTFLTDATEIFIRINGLFVSSVIALNTGFIFILGLINTYKLGLSSVLATVEVLTLVLLCLHAYSTHKGDLK